jgi:hypothetical protein
MRLTFLLILSIFGLQNLFAQELIVDSGVVLKKGVYRNFEEFKNNNPSESYSREIF